MQKKKNKRQTNKTKQQQQQQQQQKKNTQIYKQNKTNAKKESLKSKPAKLFLNL